MRARVSEIECQSCLTGWPAAYLDARRDPARGFVAIGAHQQLPAQGLAIADRHGNLGFANLDAKRLGEHNPQRRFLRSLCGECCQEMPVLDVPSERVEPNFVRRKLNFRRSPKAPGVIDDPHDLERGGLRPAARPDTQRLERSLRGSEQRRGAIVGRRISAHQDRIDPRTGKRQRSHQAGGPAANDNNLRGSFHSNAL